MPVIANIPRQTDAEIVKALRVVADNMKDIIELRLVIDVPFVGGKVLPDDISSISTDSDIGFLLSQASCVTSTFCLRSPSNRNLIVVKRSLTEAYDTFKLEDDWRDTLPEEQKKLVPKIAIKLLSECRKYLKAPDVEAALSSDPTSAWSKYRNAQTAVLNSLQQTAEAIIVDVATKNAEIDRLRAERFEKLETELRAELATERERLNQENAARIAEMEEREISHAEKEAAFETKEARYVARQKQQEQIEQLKSWLENWGLTKGTTVKRRPIAIAYISALVMTGLLTTFATWSNFELIKSAEDLTKLQWWHWLAMISKSLFPLAAFTTFMIYFIRWSAAWAKQHSEEEFRNRSRLIDIGRSGWLLEAVRDSQENGSEIPADLLKELSKNMFSHNPNAEIDIHPSAISDVVLQGLTSLRVKSPDGSEVEASRGASKK